jgi:hypothetical protein
LEKASSASYLVRLEPDGSRLSGEFLNRWSNWEVTRICIRRVATPGVHQDEGRELAKLRVIKQGLMEDLLTGCVRVTDLVTTP